MLIEYKIKPVTRYIVTRYHTSGPDGEGRGDASVIQRGEYDNAEVAFEVATALCKAEQEILGFPPGDERIQYPKPLDNAVRAA